MIRQSPRRPYTNKGIELERQEIWGAYYEAPVTRRQALGNTLAQVVLFFAVVNLAPQISWRSNSIPLYML